MSENETKTCLRRLERLIVLQQEIIDRLTTAVQGHQGAIQELARLAGLKLKQPAPAAPLIPND